MRRKLLVFRLLTFCLLLLSASAYAQVEVKGQVKDETGAPLPGAVVSVKGSRKAISTTDNGAFVISAPAGATLVVTHVGFAAKEILATPGTDMSKKAAWMLLTTRRQSAGWAATFLPSRYGGMAERINPPFD